jgi:carbamoyltransferase
MLAGTVFSSPDFVARVQRAAGVPVRVAPCPFFHGAAIGAALVCGELTAASIPQDLSIGATTTELEAKTTLENCRLDYVYEPRWPRLLERISRVIERGKLIAWFQGRAEFGFPFLGSRSFLCDPSSRYARDNVNLFLRQRQLAAPIPLALADGGVMGIDPSELSGRAITRVAIPAEWRDRVRACVDAQGFAHAYVVPRGSGPLADLLQLHLQRTGVPALANVSLRAPDDVGAVSARDAVRATFSSSADALVIHRFLLMKDYWQLRDESA